VKQAGTAMADRAPSTNPSYTRILGVDTALRCTGYGLIDTDGHRYRVVDCGVIKNKPKVPLSECLRRLSGGMSELLDEYAPDIVAIEGSFYFKNAKTAMVLGMARGAVVGVLSRAHLPMYEYAPRRVKQAVCGYGDAGKQQVALIVAKVLGIDIESVPDDATDALALCICHAQTAFTIKGLMLPDPI